MGGLHDHRHAAQHDDFVAPVELVGLPRSEAQRDVRRRRRFPMLLGPSPGVAAQRIVAAVIAAPAELLEDPDQRQLLASRLGRVAFQQFVELSRPSSQLRPRLDGALVFERRLPGSQHLADRVPGHPEVPRNLPDRLALDEVLAPNPRNRLHDQHPPTTPLRIKAGSLHRPHFRGSILDADPPD